MKTSQELFSKVSTYLDGNSIEELLKKRLNNNENENSLISADELKKTMNLDEFFYRQMYERIPNILNSPLNKYLTEISRELQIQPLLLLELPMNKLDKNILNHYLPNYNYIMSKINEIEIENNNIYKKFISSTYNINHQELSKLAKFFSYNLPHNYTKMYKAMEQVAKYILNSQKDTIYNYIYTEFLIKFFGYKKIYEDKLYDTKIIIAKLKSTTYGESTEKYAIVNKELIQIVTMENNGLTDKFGKQTKRYKIKNQERIYKVIEVLAILHTLYHEVRHQKQQQHSEKFNLDDLSYYFAAYELINKNSEYDYKTNYKCYEIEKDANYYAWEDIELLIKTYMPQKNLEITMKNILNHKLKEELEQMIGIRKTEDNQKYLSSSLLVKLLDEKIKENPYMLNIKYKQLLQFYNLDGTPKRIIELLKIPLVFNYRDFYFTQVNYRTNFHTHKLNQKDVKLSSKKELQMIINNIKILTTIAREKMNKICDRVKRYNTTETEIEGNIKNYYNFSVYLSNVVNELLILYPDLLNELSIKNSIELINANIQMINNNSLVRRTVGYINKISKVGRR